MATAPLPGSYPDSVPPTPEETMHHPVQAEQHRQPNKLHKPGDPRGQTYSGSAAGTTDRGPIVYSQVPESNTSSGSSDEALAGGNYTWGPAQPVALAQSEQPVALAQSEQPVAPLESIRTQLDTSTPTPESENRAQQARQNNYGDLAGAATRANADSTAAPGAEVGRQSPPRANESAPYWGDLPPKGTNNNGLSNTTGHAGSANHHDNNLKTRSRSASAGRSIITGHVADWPKGGVYNTVTGHGSQDSECRRHSQRRSVHVHRDVPAIGTVPTEESRLTAPFPDIPREQQKISPEATSGSTQDTAPTLLPETAVQDDVRLLEAAKRDAAQEHEVPRANTTTTQRAFPLAGATIHNDEHRRSTSPSHRGAAAGAAGAAGLAAGAAAAESRQPRGEAVPQTKQTAPVQKTRSHDERSPKGEKKHKILGLFHRHKDEDHGDGDKPRRRSADPARTTSRSPNRPRKLSKSEAARDRNRSPQSSASDSHGKEKAAVGAAAGAGAFGLLHHKRNSISEKDQQSGNPIHGPLSAETGGAGPAGETLGQVEEVPTPFEHPREPPMPPSGDHASGVAGQHAQYNVLASGTPSGVVRDRSPAARGTVVNEPGNYNTLASGTPSGVAAPASHASRRDVIAQGAGDYTELASSGAPAAASAEKDVVSREEGDYNVIQSSGAAPAEHRAPGGSGIVTQEPGNYNNTLASGTASGVKPSPTTHSGDRSSRTSQTMPSDDKTDYNVLPSGTPSGVKVKPRSPRQSTHTADQSSQGQGQYNTLPSGTPSGINHDSNDVTSRARVLNDLPVPGTTAAATASMPSSHNTHHPNANQDFVPGATTYPHPEMVQHMSPEVMPEAYTASVAQSSTHPSGLGRDTMGHQKNISPEAVMPSVYNSSAAATAPVEAAVVGHLRQGYPTEEYPSTRQAAQGMSPEVMPGAYTSSVHPPTVGRATQGGGLWNKNGKVMHRCQHCGGENDISGYLEQVMQERF